MNQKLIDQREAVAKRHDSALARWPDKTSDEYDLEMRAIVSELEHILESLAPNDPDVEERARTMHYLGMALYDQGVGSPAKGKPADFRTISESVRTYRAARSLLRADADSVLRGKIAYYLGSGLRAMAFQDGDEPRSEGEALYLEAIALLRPREPNHAKMVENELAGLRRERGLEAVKDSLIDSVKTRREAPSTIVSQVDQFKNLIFDHLAQDSVQPTPEVKANIAGQFADVTAKAAAVEPPTDDTAQLADQLLGLVRERFEQDVKAGKIDSPRQQNIDAIMRSIGQWAKGPADPETQISKGQDLLNVIAPLLATASTGNTVPPDSRAKRVGDLLSSQQQALLQNRRPGMGREERAKFESLFFQFAGIMTPLQSSGSDPNQTKRLEMERLRSLAQDVREFARRDNVMVARPESSWTTRTRDGNGVYVCGRRELVELVSEICDDMRLNLLMPHTGEGLASGRWRAIYGASVGVFELAANATEEENAETFYEIGIARTLGVPLVVVGEPETKIAFDFNLIPVRARAEVENALDAALYTYPQIETKPKAYEGTVAKALAMAVGEASSVSADEAHFLLKGIDDPVVARSKLQTLLGKAGLGDAITILPPWPPAYPDLTKPGCFHVMPFGADWSKQIMAMTSACCDRLGIAYLRGDQDLRPDIIGSIWKGIAEATHVVVDLSDLNQNVCFELGMAHTIGQNVHMLMRDDAFGGTNWDAIPMLHHQRVQRYEIDRSVGPKAYKVIVDRVLAERARG